MIPGIQNSKVRRMLIHVSFVIPTSRNTPSGGRKIAAINLNISEQVRGIVFVCFVFVVNSRVIYPTLVVAKECIDEVKGRG